MRSDIHLANALYNYIYIGAHGHVILHVLQGQLLHPVQSLFLVNSILYYHVGGKILHPCYVALVAI